MRRHVLDHTKARTTSGMKLSFSRIEKETGPRRETLLLQRRPKQRTAENMMRAFARIERGYTA
ncbi:hypothetical protein AB0T83_18270 [Fluviibacterium sp. DFM31]|uniref:Transposase n=1 Tax=Meridianimarinicoccus marinus TaxID=3231483 RepID=A0ABV3LB40_9RHOB